MEVDQKFSTLSCPWTTDRHFVTSFLFGPVRMTCCPSKWRFFFLRAFLPSHMASTAFRASLSTLILFKITQAIRISEMDQMYLNYLVIKLIWIFNYNQGTYVNGEINSFFFLFLHYVARSILYNVKSVA